jgi:hypothetical protein
MNVRSTLEGATLVVMLVLAAYSIPAPTKAAGARRDVVPEIDAGIDRRARQLLETGRHALRFDTFGSEVLWATPCSSTELSPARRTGGLVEE